MTYDKDSFLAGLSVGMSLRYSKRIPAPINCITFSSPFSFTLAVDNSTKNWNGTIEYSTNARNWITWDGTTTITAVAISNTYYIYLRGTGNTHITGDVITTRRFVLNGQNCSVSGDIECLLDYQTVAQGQHPTLDNRCYACLFENSTSLIDASGLTIPTVSNYSCARMFSNCANLSAAPLLPSMGLADGCYNLMFQQCSSLLIPPDLPAVVCKNACYRAMFSRSAITVMPYLPATQLANDCYDNMFFGCASLKAARPLPATTMYPYCYGAMFRESGLTTPPSLQALTLASGCYQNMFYGCTSLKSIPALPAETLEVGCYSLMFYGCALIKISQTQSGSYTNPYRIPQSGNGTDATSSTFYMFYQTGGTFTETPQINTTYYTSNMVIYKE